jgi:hypothetical protein
MGGVQQMWRTCCKYKRTTWGKMKRRRVLKGKKVMKEKWCEKKTD